MFLKRRDIKALKLVWAGCGFYAIAESPLSCLVVIGQEMEVIVAENYGKLLFQWRCTGCCRISRYTASVCLYVQNTIVSHNAMHLTLPSIPIPNQVPIHYSVILNISMNTTKTVLYSMQYATIPFQIYLQKNHTGYQVHYPIFTHEPTQPFQSQSSKVV